MSVSVRPPELWGCIYCMSPQCFRKRKPIPLPFPTPVPVVRDLEWWPNDKDWLYFACPECRLITAHLGIQVVQFQDPQSRPHADKLWLCISFRCAVEGCNTPVQFHVLADSTITQTTESELREKLSSGYWSGVSPCKHETSITNDQKVRFEIVRGRLQGYNPEHREWSDL